MSSTIQVEQTQNSYPHLFYFKKTSCSFLILNGFAAAPIALIASVAIPLIKIWHGKESQTAKIYQRKAKLFFEFASSITPYIYRSRYQTAQNIQITGQKMNGLLSRKFIALRNQELAFYLKSSNIFARTFATRAIFLAYGTILMITRIAEIAIGFSAIMVALNNDKRHLHCLVIQNFRPLALIEDLYYTIQGVIEPSGSKYVYRIGEEILQKSNKNTHNRGASTAEEQSSDSRGYHKILDNQTEAISSDEETDSPDEAGSSKNKFKASITEIE